MALGFFEEVEGIGDDAGFLDGFVLSFGNEFFLNDAAGDGDALAFHDVLVGDFRLGTPDDDVEEIDFVFAGGGVLVVRIFIGQGELGDGGVFLTDVADGGLGASAAEDIDGVHG